MESVWPRCLERLEAELSAEDVHTWLKPLQASPQGDGLVLYAPNAFVVDTVRERYLARIRELIAPFRRPADAGVAGSRLDARASAAPAAGGGLRHARRRRRRRRVPRQPGQALHLRQLRRGPQQPAGPRRRAAGGAEPGPRLQPAAAVRRHRPGQDPPDVRRRQPDARQQPRHARAVPAFGTVLQRDDEIAAGEVDGPVQAPVPAGGRAADRRHPVLRRQEHHPGRVLPHLQHAVRRQAADHPDLRPLPARSGKPRAAAEIAPGLGPVGGDRAARLRDPRRDPHRQGATSAAWACPRTWPT